MRRTALKRPTTRKCAGCGGRFEVRHATARYCSRECANRYAPRRPSKGPAHYRWKGDAASVASKRARAQKAIPLGGCERCDRPAVDRHYRDGDPGNGAAENVERLCRGCHMRADGRMPRFREVARDNALKRSVWKRCSNCGRRTKKLTRKRCYTCHMFWLRTGQERDPAREGEAAVAWWRRVAVGRKCAVCRRRREIQGHHVVRQQHLRAKAQELGIDPAKLLWDPRSGMALCRRCHERHTNAVARVPRDLVPAAAEDFVREYGLEWRLERDYPVREVAA